MNVSIFRRGHASGQPPWLDQLLERAHERGAECGLFDWPPHLALHELRNEVAARLLEEQRRIGGVRQALEAAERERAQLVADLGRDPDPYAPVRPHVRAMSAAILHHADDETVRSRPMVACIAAGTAAIAFYRRIQDKWEIALLVALAVLVTYAMPAITTLASAGRHAAAVVGLGASIGAPRIGKQARVAWFGVRIPRWTRRLAEVNALAARYAALVDGQFAAGYQLGAEARRRRPPQAPRSHDSREAQPRLPLPEVPTHVF